MSKRLKDLVTAKVLELGNNGVEKLAIETDLSPSTVRNAKLRGQVSESSAYTLALACGVGSKEEAQAIAIEASSQAKETA